MMAMVIAMQFFIACTESDDIFVDPVEPMSAVDNGVWPVPADAADTTVRPNMNKDDYFVLDTWMIEVAGPTEIEAVSVERLAVSGQRSAVSEAGVWFDLFGRKLPGKPTAPGWYINDGKKIAITK